MDDFLDYMMLTLGETDRETIGFVIEVALSYRTPEGLPFLVLGAASDVDE